MERTKRILIIYATAGIGHKKASMAVKEALTDISLDGVEVMAVDSLDYTTGLFRWVYLKFYLILINQFPFLWGLGYYLTDNYFFNLVFSAIRRISNWSNAKKLAKFIKSYKPEVIVSSHFFASEVVSDMKSNGETEARLVTVVTDYRLHSWWIADKTDFYIVGSEEARSDIVKWGTPEERIKVFGIPVEPVFLKGEGKEKTREKLGLKKDIFTVLVIGGGFGVGPIEDIVRTLGTISKPIQVVTICGHNEKLLARLEDIKNKTGLNAKILGYTTNVYDYMEAADILISKSGGITTTEALAKGLPMVIIAPILGQETRNADFLVSNKAALRVDNMRGLQTKLNELLNDPGKLNVLRDGIIKIKKSNACYDIAKFVVSLAEK